jgi:hypothetical protein
MAHHDPDLIVISESLRREITEHPQMAMLAVNAIFRGVMGMKCGHEFAAVQFEVYRTLAGHKECKAGIFLESPSRFQKDPGMAICQSGNATP